MILRLCTLIVELSGMAIWGYLIANARHLVHAEDVDVIRWVESVVVLVAFALAIGTQDALRAHQPVRLNTYVPLVICIYLATIGGVLIIVTYVKRLTPQPTSSRGESHAL